MDSSQVTTMEKIESQIDQARRQAGAAEAQVEAISRKLLAKLRELPYRETSQHVEDRRLTAKDRAALQAHLQRQLPSRAPKRAAPKSARFIWPNRVLTWPLRHIRLTAAVAVIAAISYMAWENTPQTIGMARLAYELEVGWPDGTVQPLKDNYAVIGLVEGQWQVRVWKPFHGYELLSLPYDSLVAVQ